MIANTYLRRTPAMALIAGLAILASCGPEPQPVSTTTTTTEQTTTRPMLLPAPPVSTTTTETQEFHRP